MEENVVICHAVPGDEAMLAEFRQNLGKLLYRNSSG